MIEAHEVALSVETNSSRGVQEGKAGPPSPKNPHLAASGSGSAPPSLPSKRPSKKATNFKARERSKGVDAAAQPAVPPPAEQVHEDLPSTPDLRPRRRMGRNAADGIVPGPGALQVALQVIPTVLAADSPDAVGRRRVTVRTGG